MDGLLKLNELPAQAAENELLRCCGCRRWARDLAARRPFLDKNQLFAAADSIWAGLKRPEWREAFARHPKIGNKKAAAKKFAATRAWARKEQAGAVRAPGAVLEELAEKNRRYETKFGYIFIVCALGKTAEEMLDLLRERLNNTAETEIALAAAEQAKITKIRLEKLINP